MHSTTSRGAQRIGGLAIAAAFMLVPPLAASQSRISAAPPRAASSAPPATRRWPAATPSAAELAAWTASCSSGEPRPFLVVLGGTGAPLGQRRAVLASIERCAQRGNVAAQSLLGALYWMGDALPSPLVARDPAKAVMYLSNAAAHGDIRDMAKLAEIEIALGHPQEAWVWAQLFAHYAVPRTVDAARVPDEHYVADLVARVDADLGPGHLRDLSADAGAFIARYGAGILAYRRAAPPPATAVVGEPPAHFRFARARESEPEGLADYLVSVGPDGIVKQAWNIDAFPSPRMGPLLRPLAMDTRFARTDKPGVRFLVVPVDYHDQRYVIAPRR